MQSNVTITKVMSASTPKVEATAVATPVVKADATTEEKKQDEAPKADANPTEVVPDNQAMHACPACNGTGKLKAEEKKEEPKMEEKKEVEKMDATPSPVVVKAEVDTTLVQQAVAKVEAQVEKIDPYAKGKLLKHANTGRHFQKTSPLNERQQAFANKMSEAFGVEKLDEAVDGWKKQNNLK